jgi:hypothetical protein
MGVNQMERADLVPSGPRIQPTFLDRVTRSFLHRGELVIGEGGQGMG